MMRNFNWNGAEAACEILHAARFSFESERSIKMSEEGASSMGEHHWQNLLPVDRYQVKTNGSPTDDEMLTVTRLYLPLIGSEAFSLYMVLKADVDSFRCWGDEGAHVSLMSMTGQDMKQLFEARKTLEGIGLLQTYLRTEKDVRHYVYELQPPLSPNQFFTDGMLNVYLYNKLGKTTFHKIKRDMVVESLAEEGFEQVTHSFNEVFTSLNPSELLQKAGSEMEGAFELQGANKEYKSKADGGVSFGPADFDFDFLLAGISDQFLPQKAFTTTVKDAIIKVAYIYNIPEMDMQQVVLNSIDLNTDQISIEQLRKEASSWYQTRHGGGLPDLVRRKQPAKYRTGTDAPATEEEKKIRYWEESSPYQVIKDISGGEPSAADLKLVEDIMFKQKLLPGVMNVLLEFVMLKHDMKLTKSYIEKVASHWARKNIKTVKEAMAYARAEHQRTQTEQTEKKNRASRKKTIRTEMLPDWLKKQENKQSKAEETADSDSFDEERKKLEESLREFKKEN